MEYLREFVNERLTVAAEEIFRVVKRTIVEYEQELERQRRLLDMVWKPEVRLHRTWKADLDLHVIGTGHLVPPVPLLFVCLFVCFWSSVALRLQPSHLQTPHHQPQCL